MKQIVITPGGQVISNAYGAPIIGYAIK